MAQPTQPAMQQQTAGMNKQPATTQSSVVQKQPAVQQTGAAGNMGQTGAKPMEEKPSIFKKWWFWVILVIVGLLIGGGLYYLIG